MRLIVFFDLPMVSKSEKRIYNKFRKWLIENGYVMIQYSIYVKLFNNRDSATKHLVTLKRYVPKQGQIRVMMITEKQYENIEIIVGGISTQENISNIETLVIL